MKILNILMLLVASAVAQTIPPGTLVSIRTVDTVDSKTADPGKTYNASLEEPLVVDNLVLAPKGSKAVLKVSEVKESGKIKGAAGLTISLTSIEVGSNMIIVETESVSSESSGKGSSTAKKAAIGSAAGAIGGAIFGKGKGAVIGAAAGAGAGIAVSLATQGPVVKIPPETRLTFVTR